MVQIEQHPGTGASAAQTSWPGTFPGWGHSPWPGELRADALEPSGHGESRPSPSL